MPDIQKSANSRIFLIEDMAGPARAPELLGFARAQSPDWAGGDRTPVRIPDPDRYGQFKTVDFIDGAKGLPSLGVQTRYTDALSTLFDLFRRGCPADLQVHMGACEDPNDFDLGWQKILVLENARPTNWGTSDLGALDADANNPVDEETPFTGLDMYEIARLTPEAQAAAEITDEVVAVVICDEIQCGECGIPSNGTNKIFALVGPVAGSPGLPSEIVFSDDGGATYQSTNVTTLPLGQAGTAMACVGPNLVVVSNASESLHYAPIADILLGTEVWVEVSTGFVGSSGPNAIMSLGRTRTWMVGDGGYVYKSADITAGVEVQSAGAATTQNLNAIAAFDEDSLMAVGEANATITTENGGDTWGAITGPAAAVVLNAVASRQLASSEWFIGAANGNLYYTQDGGITWTIRTFPGSAAGEVRDIVFVSPTVGYLAHDTAAPAGRILRTISGGNSWYLLPESEGQTFPANDQINSLAATKESMNLVYGGGLGDDGSDGILVKASA